MTARSFYFTRMGLEDKGLIACRERVRLADGVEVKDRFYRRIGPAPF